jgi:hypothetical protein
MAAVVVHLPLTAHEVAAEVVRHELPHFFRFALPPPLVRSLEPQVVCGFSQTTYPPCRSSGWQWSSRLIGLDMAYMAVQFAPFCFSWWVFIDFRCFGSARAPHRFAALASVFLGSESFLVYSAGSWARRLPRPLFERPAFLFEWVRHGKWRSFLKGGALFTAAAAAHHATLLFGSIFFAVPVLALVVLDRQKAWKRWRTDLSPGVSASHRRIRPGRRRRDCARASSVLDCLIHYPVTQTPIPHIPAARITS